ncbi:bacteriocin immunity protein [Pantoea sp. EKM21T]|uniref:bacteriocin immunity protein n=1 Tax=unclassified Pantoea TaxID=2630326 RepID=UPI00142E6B50|nr:MULTISPECIES: bacteriocin immunity protein [unclassified Pantoea]KAF6676814.1 bacteriocin immunity protein [Pantoea sp. EKM21T]KAF6685962.1 bacteriocin immunity protein [Pantoea sp. EKM22T]
MNVKPKFEDYTEAEFTKLVSEICNAKGGESYQDKLLENFISVSEHPEGSDLIYYSEDEDATPEKIVAAVKAWRKAHGKRGFKS